MGFDAAESNTFFKIHNICTRYIYLFLYILSTLHIYNILYWWEVNVAVSMNSLKVPLHISLHWNSDGRLADQINAL